MRCRAASLSISRALLSSQEPTFAAAKETATPGLKLRPYHPDDLDRLHALDAECFDERFRFSRRALRSFLEAPEAIALIAASGGKILAFCIVHLHGAASRCFGYVVTLDVSAEARRTGIGRELLLAVEDLALAQGAASMRLHVFSGNEGAQAFYRLLEYKEVKRAPAFYGEALDALIMAKRLA